MADDALPDREDQAITVDALATDSNVDSDGLVITSASAAPATGTAAVVIENGRTVIAFTPAKDYHGLAVVNYTISDGHGGTDTAVLKIDVAPVNEAPKGFFIIWREQKLGDGVRHSAWLVERRPRVSGKLRQIFVGSYEVEADAPAPNLWDEASDEVLDKRLQFWRSAHAVFDADGIHGKERTRIGDALARRVPSLKHVFEFPDYNALPEIISPVGPDDMPPFYCALAWLATKGGSTVVENPRDAAVWQPAYGKLRARIYNGDVEVSGDPGDGFMEQVPGKYFSPHLKVVYPFQVAPPKLLLGKKMYLCCEAPVEEEGGQIVSGDTLRRGRDVRWEHLAVSRAGIRRFWPFGVNEEPATEIGDAPATAPTLAVTGAQTTQAAAATVTEKTRNPRGRPQRFKPDQYKAAAKAWRKHERLRPGLRNKVRAERIEVVNPEWTGLMVEGDGSLKDKFKEALEALDREGGD